MQIRSAWSLNSVTLEEVKVISEALGLQQTTGRAIIYKVVNLPRSGQSSKICPKCALKTHPGGRKKEPQTSPASSRGQCS